MMNFTTTLLLFSQLCIAVSTASTIRGGSDIDEQKQLEQQLEELQVDRQLEEEQGEQQQFEQQLEEQRERELKESRIIGGTRAMDGEYPYAVSLQDEKGPYCGASLIAPDMLLTAAHCKQNKSIKAVIGRYDLRDTSVGDVVDVTAENQIRHAGYDPQTTDSDLMLIKLNRKTRATDTPYEDRVVRFGNYYISSDTPASVMGWGVTNPSGGLLPSTLMHAEVFTISNEECAASSGFIGNFQADYTDAITPNMLCAKDEGEDSCQGDSGGPLVYKTPLGWHIQIGVVSWGIGCADPDFPGVYARTSKRWDWIRRKICILSDEPPAYLFCENGW